MTVCLNYTDNIDTMHFKADRKKKGTWTLCEDVCFM